MGTGLYIHIPFCAVKCPYCAFAVAVGQANKEADYLKALEQERVPEGEEVVTVYVGGGTPSCLSPSGIERLFLMARRRFRISADAEITVEMNPESTGPEKAALLKKCGVTRVSLGVQSLNDDTLKALGRPHDASAARDAFTVLRDAGFNNINTDLIFGLPGQTRADVARDLEQSLQLGGEHLSLYSLNIEPRSLFFARGVKVDAHIQGDLYEDICRGAAAAGLEQYEISNFSRPGFASRHNMNYWEGGVYIGLGMAAHSHWDAERFWNADALPRYLELMRTTGSARTGSERLSPAEKLVETFLFSLRMNRGADPEALERRYKASLGDQRREILESFITGGFLEEAGPFIRATPRGRLVLDEISARII